MTLSPSTTIKKCELLSNLFPSIASSIYHPLNTRDTVSQFIFHPRLDFLSSTSSSFPCPSIGNPNNHMRWWRSRTPLQWSGCHKYFIELVPRWTSQGTKGIVVRRRTKRRPGLLDSRWIEGLAEYLVVHLNQETIQLKGTIYLEATRSLYRGGKIE